MARVKRGLSSHKRHKRLHEATKGFRGTRNRLVRVAHEAELHAGAYAYHGRKRKKRDFRALWITRISEATKALGMPYSRFINALKKAQIGLDRKILSDMVLNDAETFKHIVEKVKSA